MTDDTPPYPDRAFYHRFAWAYDLLIERPAGPQVADVAAVLSDHGCAVGSDLIDAGCGTGSYAVALALLGFHVVALDASEDLLTIAQSRADGSRARVAFVHADLTGEWRPDHPADGVLCRGVLNDLLTDSARERAFAAFAAWLRPGGVLLLDVRDTEQSRARYTHGREFNKTAIRGNDTLTFSSRTTMAPHDDVMELAETWTGTVDGGEVTREDVFRMRTWSWETLQTVARAADFAAVTRIPNASVGAREDRIVAVAVR